MLRKIFQTESKRQEVLVSGIVVADASRCVQCGICSFNCPANIDVRRHAWEGKPVVNSRCLTCSECIERCPRGALHFGLSNLYKGA